MSTAIEAIAATAARLVVEEGQEYGPAKRRAARQLGLNERELPDNDVLEAAVREHLALFHADTQPGELRAMRELALVWMDRLREFRPHLAGAVWRGTATRLNAIHLQLYCDDPKSAEIALLNERLSFDVGSTRGPRGQQVDVLSLAAPCPVLGEHVTLHLSILDHDDLRGGLRRDAQGRRERGDAQALRTLLANPESPDDAA